jgi:hypothetical protein
MQLEFFILSYTAGLLPYWLQMHCSRICIQSKQSVMASNVTSVDIELPRCASGGTIQWVSSRRARVYRKRPGPVPEIDDGFATERKTRCILHLMSLHLTWHRFLYCEVNADLVRLYLISMRLFIPNLHCKGWVPSGPLSPLTHFLT